MSRSRRTSHLALPDVASHGDPTARGRRRPSVRAVAGLAVAALLLVGCGADDASSEDTGGLDDAAAPEDDTDDPDQADPGDVDAEGSDADHDAADPVDAEQDDAAGGGYVHPVSTDLPLPTEHCELAVYVHGQRHNGGALVGPIAAFHQDGTVDMAAAPYGILHYENVIAGIEALDDPELETALEQVSTFHAEVSSILDRGLEDEELAVALAEFHYGSDPSREGEGGELIREFEQEWIAWLGPQDC